MEVDRTIYAPSREYAERVAALLDVHPDGAEWQAGSSEPWVVAFLQALIVANDVYTAVEIGAFKGYASVRIAEALDTLPHATEFRICEIDEARAHDVTTRLPRYEHVSYRVDVADSHRWIPTLEDESVDFVWLDGSHEKMHVAKEIALLLRKLRPGGIIAGHDVYGSCDLQGLFREATFPYVFGVEWRAMALDLPRLGPAGGIGLIQRPR